MVSTAALSGQITCGQWFLSDEVRRTWRETLNEVEHRDAHTAVMRYLTPTAVIVQVAWYEAAVAPGGISVTAARRLTILVPAAEAGQRPVGLTWCL